MANFNTFNCLTQDMFLGKHVIGTHSYKVMLTNSAPLASNTIKSNITEIAAVNGYVAGGGATTLTESSSSGVVKVLASDVVFTAAGGPVGPFRYEVLYNATNNALVGWTDHGSAVTMADTDDHTVDFDGVNGVITNG